MARNLYAEVTARIVAELEAGAAPWVKPWSALGAGHGSSVPHNAATGRPYSGVNLMLLWMAGHAGAPCYLTFKQASESGGHVRKGEHGTHIVFVKQIREKDEDTGKERRAAILRDYTVFHVSQCEGLPEHLVTGGRQARPRNPDARDDEADAFLVATGAAIVEAPSDVACYRPSADRIELPRFADFRSASHFYGTAFHELGHWTGAGHRLARDLSGRFGNRRYAAEELIAELTAAFLCAEFGLQRRPAARKLHRHLDRPTEGRRPRDLHGRGEGPGCGRLPARQGARRRTVRSHGRVIAVQARAFVARAFAAIKPATRRGNTMAKGIRTRHRHRHRHRHRLLHHDRPPLHVRRRHPSQ